MEVERNNQNQRLKPDLSEIEDSNSTPKKTCMTSPSASLTPSKEYNFVNMRRGIMISEHDSVSSSKSKFEIIDDEEDVSKLNLFENESRFANEYIQLEMLGSGNFGKVYRCQNKTDK